MSIQREERLDVCCIGSRRLSSSGLLKSRLSVWKAPRSFQGICELQTPAPRWGAGRIEHKIPQGAWDHSYHC